MSEARWTEVDNFLEALIIKPDPVFDAVLAASKAAGLPEIAISPAEGKQLHLLAQMSGARRILEIGTLGGYSTLWLAKALPEDGLLISLEYDPHHAEVAQENLSKAGLAHKVEVKIGPALDTLATLDGPFDFFFIDANKDGYPAYFRWAMKLARPGSVIVADNVVRDGKVADIDLPDPAAKGVRDMLALAATYSNLTATVIQTVGRKGYDGYFLGVVEEG